MDIRKNIIQTALLLKTLDIKICFCQMRSSVWWLIRITFRYNLQYSSFITHQQAKCCFDARNMTNSVLKGADQYVCSEWKFDIWDITNAILYVVIDCLFHRWTLACALPVVRAPLSVGLTRDSSNPRRPLMVKVKASVACVCYPGANGWRSRAGWRTCVRLCWNGLALTTCNRLLVSYLKHARNKNARFRNQFLEQSRPHFIWTYVCKFPGCPIARYWSTWSVM